MRRLVQAVVLLGAIMAQGCGSLRNPGDITPESLLQAAHASPQSVALDIYWARVAAQEPAWHDALWESVQEERIQVEVRRALAENGLRAGVVGGNPNNAIVRLLNPNPEATPEQREQAALSGEAKVTRRMMSLRQGQRGEVQATPSAVDCTLIRRREGELTGRPYSRAQGLYAVEVIRREGDRIELELTPEVQHGQPKMQYTAAGPGTVVQRPGQDREIFDDLRTRVSLVSGEMLVVAPLPDAASKLGGMFHTTAGVEGAQQRILLVRLSQVPPSKALAEQTAAWPWD